MQPSDGQSRPYTSWIIVGIEEEGDCGKLRKLQQKLGVKMENMTVSDVADVIISRQRIV